MPRPSTEMRHNTQPKGHFGRQNVHKPMLCSLHAISLCSTVVCYNDGQQESWRTEQKKLKKDAAFLGINSNPPAAISLLPSTASSSVIDIRLAVGHKITHLCLYFLGKNAWFCELRALGFLRWDSCRALYRAGSEFETSPLLSRTTRGRSLQATGTTGACCLLLP